MSVKVKLWKGQRGVYGVFVNHRGQRTAKKVGDEQAAKTVKRQLEEELARGDFHLPQRALTFKTLAEEWLQAYPAVNTQVSESTMRNYHSFVAHHLIPHFGSKPVADIGYLEIEAFIIAKRSAQGSTRFAGQPIGDQTLRVGLVALRLILQRAVTIHRVLEINPALGVAKFKRPTDEETAEPFTGQELRAILTAAVARDRTFATFLRVWAQSGMRLGEVCALQNQDLDLVAGTAEVRRTWSHQRLGPTKTRLTRTVSFLHPVTEATSEWRPGKSEDSRRVLTELKALPVRSLQPEAFVFGVQRPWSTSWVNDTWRKILAGAKVRYRNPEQLRHTFASTLLSRNAPVLYVQKQGGWKSAAVMLKVYSKWVEQAQREHERQEQERIEQQQGPQQHDQQRPQDARLDATPARPTQPARRVAAGSVS